MEKEEENWKLKLHYGKITTPYFHYTLIAEGTAGDLEEGFECRQGKAFMGMKVWASSHDEAFDMIEAIGEQIGFSRMGKIEIFDTEPQEPPKEDPYGYDIKFIPINA
jgi:hypothetical protein